jgi:hypothetical protein
MSLPKSLQNYIRTRDGHETVFILYGMIQRHKIGNPGIKHFTDTLCDLCTRAKAGSVYACFSDIMRLGVIQH